MMFPYDAVILIARQKFAVESSMVHPLLFHIALVAALLPPPTTTASAQSCPCNTSSSYALLMDFYTTTIGWIIIQGWGNTSVPICSWYGEIRCSSQDIVTIKVSNNNITGTLPVSWANLTQLRELFLHDNSLTGTLPPSWSSMSQLSFVDLSSNSLTGTLPPSWSNMTQHLCYGVCRL